MADVANLKKQKSKYFDFGFKMIFLSSAVVTLLTTVLIAYSVFSGAAHFFKEVSVFDFLFGTEWTPLFEPRKFGVLPLVWGTLMIAIGACVIAVPVGICTAAYLSVFAPRQIRTVLKPVLEILAGVPSVVYGYFALTTITPILQYFNPEVGIFNAASGMIVLAIMVLPVITSIAEDSISSLPRSLKESAYACGATDYEVVRHILIPSAAPGIIASVILAFSRAIGETMAVTLAAGATPNLSIDIFSGVQTMTAYIVQVCLGDAQHGTVAYYSIFAVALTLFLITLLMNMMSFWVRKKMKLKV